MQGKGFTKRHWNLCVFTQDSAELSSSFLLCWNSLKVVFLFVLFYIHAYLTTFYSFFAVIQAPILQSRDGGSWSVCRWSAGVYPREK